MAIDKQSLDYELRRNGYKDVFFDCHLSLLVDALKKEGHTEIADIDIDSVVEDLMPYFDPAEFVEDVMTETEIAHHFGDEEPEVTWYDLENDERFDNYKFYYEDDDGCGITEKTDADYMPA